jgi:hypothetical protein
MSMSMYRASVPVFLQILPCMSAILDKAAAYAAAKKYPDTETTFDELKARIAKTVAFIKEFKPSQIDGSEERDISLQMGGQMRTFKGENYLTSVVLPNFFFHATTTYAILRHSGVELGKQDFLRSPG